MIRSRWAFHGLVMLAAVSLFGCGGDGKPPRYPVSGTVTFQGAPAADGTVNFYRKEVGSIGVKIGADGKFNFEETQGLEEGEYQVYVMPPEQFTTPPQPGRAMEPAKEFPNFPPKYREVATTDFKAKVEPTSDGNDFTFDMTP